MKYTIIVYSFTKHRILSTDEFEGSYMDAFNNFNGYVDEHDRLYPDERASITCTSEGKTIFSATVGKNEFETLGEGELVKITISHYRKRGETRENGGGDIRIDALGIHSTKCCDFNTFEEVGRLVVEALYGAAEAKKRFKEKEAAKLAAKASESSSDDDEYWECE